MTRGLALLVMLVSFVGTGCRKSENKTPAPAVEVKTEKPTAPSAATADPWKHEATKKDPLKAIFFWSAEKDGKTTYFLGTMHIGVDPETRLPQVVWDRLDAAKTFAMEADLSDPELAESMMRKGGSLSADLGEAHWKKLEQAVGPAMAKQLDQLTPTAAAAVMSLKDLPKTAPMDGVLLGRAMNQKKQIVYLEPASLQAEVLAKHMDLRALKMMIDTYEQGAAQSKAMLDAYIAGEPAGILKVTEEQKAEALKYGYTQAEYDEQMEDILYKRNASWISALEKLHAQGDGFVAVGALHLIGPRSVLEMLAEKGYKISRITP